VALKNSHWRRRSSSPGATCHAQPFERQSKPSLWLIKCDRLVSAICLNGMTSTSGHGPSAGGESTVASFQRIISRASLKHWKLAITGQYCLQPIIRVLSDSRARRRKGWARLKEYSGKFAVGQSAANCVKGTRILYLLASFMQIGHEPSGLCRTGIFATCLSRLYPDVGKSSA